MEPSQLLQAINHTQGTTFTLLQRYPIGEQGAFAITDEQGKQYVLKWNVDTSSLRNLEDAKAITDLLHSLEYPVPRYVLLGHASTGIYSIQEALPGSLILHLTAKFLPRLLELNELQRNRALASQSQQNWHQVAVKTVLYGGNGYCLHSSLQEHSRETAQLLQELQGLVVAHQDVPHRTNDIVHGDFHLANILAHNEQVSGVIDWSPPGMGDCVFDLVTLLFYAYDDPTMLQQLWQSVLEHASPQLLSVYCAHMILRQVDWSLRYHDQAASDQYIKQGQALLCDLAAML